MVRSIPFLSFIEPIFAWNVPLVSLIFLTRSLVFPILLFSSIPLHWSLIPGISLCKFVWMLLLLRTKGYSRTGWSNSVKREEWAFTVSDTDQNLYTQVLFSWIPYYLLKGLYCQNSAKSAKDSFLGGSVVKILPAKQEKQVWSLDHEGPLEEEMATHSRILPWKIPGQRSLGGYSA